MFAIVFFLQKKSISKYLNDHIKGRNLPLLCYICLYSSICFLKYKFLYDQEVENVLMLFKKRTSDISIDYSD